MTPSQIARVRQLYDIPEHTTDRYIELYYANTLGANLIMLADAWGGFCHAVAVAVRKKWK